MKSFSCIILFFIALTTSLSGQTIKIGDEEVKKKKSSSPNETSLGIGIHTFYGGKIEDLKGGIGIGGDIFILSKTKKPIIFFSYSRAGTYNYDESLGTGVIQTELEINVAVNVFRIGTGITKNIVPFFSASTVEVDATASHGSNSLSIEGKSEEPDYGAGILFKIPFSEERNTGINIQLEYNGSTEGVGFGVGISF